MNSFTSSVSESGKISQFTVQAADHCRRLSALYHIRLKQCELAWVALERAFHRAIDHSTALGTFRSSEVQGSGSSLRSGLSDIGCSRWQIGCEYTSFQDLSFDIRPGLSEESENELHESNLETSEGLHELISESDRLNMEKEYIE
jgi:hypothetical protein